MQINVYILEIDNNFVHSIPAIAANEPLTKDGCSSHPECPIIPNPSCFGIWCCNCLNDNWICCIT